MRRIISRQIIAGASFLLSVTANPRMHGKELVIEIGAPTEIIVGAQLNGMNVVYSHESMDTWKDEAKLVALKDARINCLRYPGGHVVSFWDWEFPYHETYENFWDPAYIATLTPERKAELKKQFGHRMSLSDFFKICSEAKLEPLVGINMFQGYKFDRLQDSIAKAERLVRHCNQQNPRVNYYYLDNESGHQPEHGKHIPIDDYIQLIPAYSKAIKAIQPDAKLIVNPIHWDRVRGMVEQAGRHFDVLDFHWYYNNRKWGRFYIEDWRKEAIGRKFSRKASQFNHWKKSTGNEHLQLAVLEWNLGPATGAEGSDPSSDLLRGLVQADMLMQFVKHEVGMAASWPMTWKPSAHKASGGFRSFLNAETGKASPSRHIYKWFSMAGGGTLLKSSSQASKGTEWTSVRSKDGKTALIYLLNKSKEGRSVTLNFTGPIESASANSFEQGKDVNDVKVRDVPAEVTDKRVTLEMRDTSFAFIQVQLR